METKHYIEVCSSAVTYLSKRQKQLRFQGLSKVILRWALLQRETRAISIKELLSGNSIVARCDRLEIVIMST
jgi:hypothetical protein